MKIQRVVFEKAECFINDECIELESGNSYRIETADVIFKNALLDEMDNICMTILTCDQLGGIFDIGYEDIIEISEVD